MLKALFRIFFLFFILIFSLGQLERIQIGATQGMYLHDILLIAWCATALFQSDFRQQLRSFFRQHSALELLFAGWILLGLAISFWRGNAIAPSFLYLCRLTLYFLFGQVLIFSIKKNILKLSEVLFGLLYAGFLILLFGFLQYFFLPDTRFLFFLGWDDHLNRLISTLLDPGFTGIIFVLTFFLLHYAAEKFPIKFLAIVGKIALSIGILLTYSRASYLAYLCGLGLASILFLRQKKVRAALAPILFAVVFVVAIPFLPKTAGEGVQLARSSTVNARTQIIQQVVSQMQPLDWVFGRGIFVKFQAATTNTEVSATHSNVADNWLVMTITGTGIVGTILALWLIVKIFLTLCRVIFVGILDCD